MVGILVPITIFIAAGVVLFKFIDARHRERNAIIEKGLNPADYAELYKRQAYSSNPLSSLKWGLLIFFSGLGCLGAIILYSWFHVEEMVFPSMILVFGGLGLIIYYFVAAKKIKDL